MEARFWTIAGCALLVVHDYTSRLSWLCVQGWRHVMLLGIFFLILYYKYFLNIIYKKIIIHNYSPHPLNKKIYKNKKAN